MKDKRERELFMLGMMIKLVTMLAIMMAPLASRAVNIQHFTFTQNPNFAIMEDALDPNSIMNNNYEYLFTGSYHFVKSPLVVLDGQEKGRRSVLIEHFNSLNLGFGKRLGAKSLIGFETFVSQAKFQDETRMGWGDTSLTYKYRLTETSTNYALAIVPKIFLPTGDTELFLSDESFGYGLILAFEKNLRWLQLVINAGYIRSEDAIFRNLDYREKFLTSIGAYIPIQDNWGYDIEIAKYNTLPLNDGAQPFEFFNGIRYQADDSQVYYGGIGVGDPTDAYGNDYRIVVGLKWTPPFYEEKNTPEAWDRIQRSERTKYGYLASSKNVYFANASSALSQASKDILKSQYEYIIDNLGKIKIIHVQGYSSPVGNPIFNKKISILRAKNVLRYLVRLGVPESKLKAVNGGDQSSPLENYAANRRVEIRIFEK